MMVLFFYFDAVKVKFFASFDHRTIAAAIGAWGEFFFNGKFGVTVMAFENSRDTIEDQFSAITNRTFADCIPIELNRIIHNAGKSTDDQVDSGDPGGISLSGMFNGNI
jgi:hypothetical protein